MFPEVVRNIIETYALDMQSFEEMKKLKYNKYLKKIIQKGDEVTDRMMERAGMNNVDLDRDNKRGLKMILLGGLEGFFKSTAGFVYKKIHKREIKRQKLWENIGIPITHGFGQFQWEFEGHTCIWEIYGDIRRKEPKVAIAIVRGVAAAL